MTHFFPFFLYLSHRKLLSLLSLYFLDSIHHFCFFELFCTKYWSTALIWLLWFVSWDVICHISTPSVTHFFPFFLYLSHRKLLSLLSPYFLGSIHHFCFFELFFTKYWSTALIWLLFLLRFSLNVFFVCIPCKAGWNVFMGKSHPTKARSRFYECGICVRWTGHILERQGMRLMWIKRSTSVNLGQFEQENPLNRKQI